ncbi:hypothetical protein Tco_0079168 [Tanacetum coccineum]
MDDTRIFDGAYDEDVGAEADLDNLETTMHVSPIPTTRIHKDHPLRQIIRDFHSAPLTRRMSQQNLEELGTQESDSSYWKIQAVRSMEPKFFRNKKMVRGVVVRNKQDWAQGYTTQKKVVNYNEVFAHVAMIEGYEDPHFPDKVYKVEKALYGLHQAPRAWCMLMISSLGLQSSLCVQSLKKFDYFSVKIASTPIETNKALVKDEEAKDVDVHLYRSMIGSLMYLTASRPDIMFAVCACARFQVTPKTSHLHAMKRIFRYLKGQSKLGLWYPRDSPFDLEAFSDSDYAGVSIDRKFTTGGCQFLGKRLISWQCKKQTVVANSTTEAEYVVSANCYGQVLWIQNQLLDYGFNFMNTKIYIDNESTICIVKNPVLHAKTKHIEIMHHFIRDCHEKKLIQVIKIHTD